MKGENMSTQKQKSPYWYGALDVLDKCSTLLGSLSQQQNAVSDLDRKLIAKAYLAIQPAFKQFSITTEDLMDSHNGGEVAKLKKEFKAAAMANYSTFFSDNHFSLFREVLFSAWLSENIAPDASEKKIPNTLKDLGGTSMYAMVKLARAHKKAAKGEESTPSANRTKTPAEKLKSTKNKIEAMKPEKAVEHYEMLKAQLEELKAVVDWMEEWIDEYNKDSKSA